MTARSPRAWLAAFLSPAGRIGRGTFVLAVVAVYAAWYATPFALNWIASLAFGETDPFPSPEFWMGLALYPAVAALTYVSFCVHRKRLADARRTTLSFGLMVFASVAAIVVGLLVSLATVSPVAVHGGTASAEVNIDVGRSSWTETLPLLAFLAAWPLYSLWVGLAPSRAEEPAPEGQSLAA